MAKKKKKVIFRRIGGRVVPIKVEREKFDKGVKNLASGAVFGGAFGLSGGLLREKAASLGRAVQNAEDVQADRLFRGKAASKRVDRITKKLLKKEAKFFKASNIATGIASFVGGALISKGIQELAESQDKFKIDTAAEEFLSTAASGIVGLSLSAIGGPRLSRKGALAFRKAFSKTGKFNPFRASALDREFIKRKLR